jgi:hypothetical protein
LNGKSFFFIPVVFAVACEENVPPRAGPCSTPIMISSESGKNICNISGSGTACENLGFGFDGPNGNRKCETGEITVGSNYETGNCHLEISIPNEPKYTFDTTIEPFEKNKYCSVIFIIVPLTRDAKILNHIYLDFFT